MAKRSGEMAPSTSRDSSGKRRPRVRVRHVVLALLLSGVVCLLLLRWHWRRDFRQRIETVRAAGYPVTLEELDAWYEWPSSRENAAITILDAISCCDPPRREDVPGVLWGVIRNQVCPRWQPLGQEVCETVDQHLKANTKALGLLHEAAATRHSRYPIDLKKGCGSGTMWHLGDVVNRATLLVCLEAVWHGENGDPAGASGAIAVSLAIAGSLAREPMWISQVNRRTCLILSRSALQRVLSRVERFADDQLLLLSEAFADAYDPEAWTRALAGERCVVIAMHEHPDLLNDLGHFGIPRLIVNAHKELGLADRSGAAFLGLMDRLMELQRLPLHERMAAAGSVDRVRQGTSHACFILHEFMPRAMNTVTMELSEIALSRTAVCALAVERHRLACGSLPDALAELVPRYYDEVPQDPFDGKPLRYRRLDRGHAIYSIGPDGADDGGREPPHRKGSDRTDPTPYDIAFIVER